MTSAAEIMHRRECQATGMAVSVPQRKPTSRARLIT